MAAPTAPGLPERQAVVAGYVRLGDAHQGAGRLTEAIAAYRRVTEEGGLVLAAGHADPAFKQRVASAAYRLCGLLLATGDGVAALASCDASLPLYTELLAAAPENTAAIEGAAGGHIAKANALRVTGRAAEALGEIDEGARLLRILLARAPDNARVELQLATALIQQGVVLLALGRPADAVTANRDAVTRLDALRSADATNARVNALLSYLLLRQATPLIALGAVDDAAASTRRGLAMLRAHAERPGAGPTEQNDYASWLLTCEPASERRPREALRFARAATSGPPHPVYLDTLGLALFRTGDSAAAVKTAEAALALVPPAPAGQASTGLRAEIERHLSEFRGAATP